MVIQETENTNIKEEIMLPITEVPETIALGMENYRDVFCRDEGFDYVSRYVTGPFP